MNNLNFLTGVENNKQEQNIGGFDPSNLNLLNLAAIGQQPETSPALSGFNIPGGVSPSNLNFGPISTDAGGTGNGFSSFLSQLGNNEALSSGLSLGQGILGSYLALRQFGLAKDALKHNIGLDRANLANSAKLAQNRLDLQSTRRQSERPDLYSGQFNPTLRQTP